MQKRHIFLLTAVLFISSQIRSAASPEAQSHDRWRTCLESIQEGDIEKFKSSFSLDLLRIYMPMKVGAEQPLRPLNLAHVVIISRESASLQMLEHMISEGLDTRQMQSFPYQELRVEKRNGSHAVCMRNFFYLSSPAQVYRLAESASRNPHARGAHITVFTGEVSAPTLLDVAIVEADKDKVQMLLNDADLDNSTLLPENSCLMRFCKKFLISRIGKTPSTLALTLRDIAQRERCLPGYPELYEHIAELIEQERSRRDAILLNSCSIS